MVNNLLVFLGAGLGGVFRYWISSRSYTLIGHQFPYGTLIVNTTGCFLMGFLFVLLLERFDGFGPQLRSFLLIGLLGGYTTFSSFSIETLLFFESGNWLTAFLNILLSIILCVLLTWLGMIAGKHL